MEDVTIDGSKLRSIREGRDMTQGMLAKKSKVTQANISRYESGDRSNAKISTVGKLAAALGVSVGDILASSSIGMEPTIPRRRRGRFGFLERSHLW